MLLHHTYTIITTEVPGQDLYNNVVRVQAELSKNDLTLQAISIKFG